MGKKEKIYYPVVTGMWNGYPKWNMTLVSLKNLMSPLGNPLLRRWRPLWTPPKCKDLTSIICTPKLGFQIPDPPLSYNSRQVPLLAFYSIISQRNSRYIGLWNWCFIFNQNKKKCWLTKNNPRKFLYLVFIVEFLLCVLWQKGEIIMVTFLLHEKFQGTSGRPYHAMDKFLKGSKRKWFSFFNFKKRWF